MTENEALQIAKDLAATKGWTWREPVTVRRRRRWFRFVGWTVQSNAQSRGCNVYVEIDDLSGRIARAAFWPR